jgi:glycosyltransferase-like protein
VTARPMRIAMLTYSVKPRGGVVHALCVAQALAARGRAVELFAVGRPGERFFREPSVTAHVIEHLPPEAPFDARIEALIAAYRDGLRGALEAGAFDVVHAQDCVSANAALALRDERAIEAVVRTVHHVDDFRSPSLIACQRRSIEGPDEVLCVSAPWIARLRAEFGVEATVVGNGVDAARYRPPRDEDERDAARDAAGVSGRLVVLSVGGIEPRKGSLTLLEGFATLRERLPDRRPLLLVAGGATLFDYRDEIARFDSRRAELGLVDGRDVRVLGPVADAELEALYRAADVFALPSVKEGYGLVALEALAAGAPLVASDLPVFRSFLRDGHSALLARVGDAGALANALERVTGDAKLRERLRVGGHEVVAAHGWERVAAAHESAYVHFLRRRSTLGSAA